MTAISQLVAQLADKNASQRETAREQLIHLGGHEVTRELVGTLLDPRTHVRWEAAKALMAIADPVSAPALMHALDDESEDVRWVAGEGLIALGQSGMRTVLSGLIKRADSMAFCKAAHHVLRENKGFTRELAPVLAALQQSDHGIAAPVAAHQALAAINSSLKTA